MCVVPIVCANWGFLRCLHSASTHALFATSSPCRFGSQREAGLLRPLEGGFCWKPDGMWQSSGLLQHFVRGVLTRQRVWGLAGRAWCHRFTTRCRTARQRARSPNPTAATAAMLPSPLRLASMVLPYSLPPLRGPFIFVSPVLFPRSWSV